MKKFSSLLFLLLLLQQTQSQVNFTVTLVSPGASITCTQPFVTYGTSSNFGSVLSYSWANASALFTGPVAAFNIPGIYSVTASSGTLISNTQTISVGINTTAPQVYLTPPQLTISCLSSPASVSVMAMPINNIKHSIVSPYGGTLSLNNFSIAYLPGGPGSYTSVVTDLSNGCTTFTHFTVGASSTYPDFKVLSVQNFSLGCGTKSIAVVTATSLNSNLSYTLQGPGTPGSGSTYSFTQAGTWTLAATDNTSQCALQIPVQIVQNTQPPLIYADVALQVLSCQHKSVQVDGISFNSSVSFSWLYAGTPGVAPSQRLPLLIPLHCLR